jgi:CRISPR-associated protein Cas6/Cse3/CasE subtype I-E
MNNIELRLDITAAARAVTLTHTGLHDSDLLLKTALTESMGGAVIRPWALLRQEAGVAIIGGYSSLDADAIKARLALAGPALQSAVSDVASAPTPQFAVGQRLRFTVRLTPTINVTRRGERDAYIVAREAGRVDTRDAVYSAYLVERLHGAEVRFVALNRFQLVNMTRPHRGKLAPETGVATRVMPDATLAGVLVVTDPEAFASTLAQGVGRQRAYGRGMLRLEAPSFIRRRELGLKRLRLLLRQLGDRAHSAASSREIARGNALADRPFAGRGARD